MNGGKTMRRLWVSGYRSYELNVFQDDDPKVTVIKTVLKERLTAMLDQQAGEFWLISGPQMGSERWAIEVGKQLQKDYPQLKLAMMMPFAEFGQQWNEDNQIKLAQAKAIVNFSADVSDKPYQSPQQLRNYHQFMLTHTDGALFLYDPEHAGKTKYDYQAAIHYAEQQDYPVQLIDFDELQEAAAEWQERERERQTEKYGY